MEKRKADLAVETTQLNGKELVKRKSTKKELEIAEADRIRQITTEITTLSIEQLNAIDLLITGMSDRETAEKIGVARQTVTKWRLHHPALKAELERRRQELWGFSADRIRSLLPKAAEVVEQSINDPANPERLKLAVEILKQTGIFGTFHHVQQTDVMEIIKEDVQTIFQRIDQPSEQDMIDAMERVYWKLMGDELQ